MLGIQVADAVEGGQAVWQKNARQACLPVPPFREGAKGTLFAPYSLCHVAASSGCGSGCSPRTEGKPKTALPGKEHPTSAAATPILRGTQMRFDDDRRIRSRKPAHKRKRISFVSGVRNAPAPHGGGEAGSVSSASRQSNNDLGTIARCSYLYFRIWRKCLLVEVYRRKRPLCSMTIVHNSRYPGP